VLEEALPETTEVAPEWTAPAGDTGEVDDGWIYDFGDPELDALVEEAVSEQNPNMRALSAQVDRAAGLARQAGAALKPTVAMGGNLAETGSQASSTGSGVGGIGVSWEVDVWGRIRAGSTAAEESLRATQYDFEAGRFSLAANVAKGWFLATQLKMQRDLAHETVELLEEIVELVEAKHEVGQVSMQDVHLAKADLATAEDALRQVESGRQQASRTLEILVGRYPAAEVEGASELVAVPPPIPVGVPADVLERRPDLRAAESRVASAFYMSEQARLAKLPRFSLTAGVGSASAIDSLVGNLAAGITAPLYTGGALEGQIDIANADQKAAVAAYGATVLKAFEEVETSLANEDLFAQREEFLTAAVDGNYQAYELGRTQYEVGKIDLLSLLQMQSRWIGAKIGLIAIRNDRLDTRVNLHLALGGSFEETDDIEGGEDPLNQ
jgi:NodT family efflux transporter outer membrane factor (OMF) lipoprotein